MHLIDQVHRLQRVRFPRSGCSAALIDTSHCAVLTQDDRTAGKGFFVLCMANPQARDGGETDLSIHGVGLQHDYRIIDK